jgi:hypothetical protein
MNVTYNLHNTGNYVKVKGQVHLRTDYEGPQWVWRYSSTLSLTSALDGVGGQHHTPEKTRYQLHRRLGGPQSRPGRLRTISPSPGFDPRTVQPVASRYTN